MPELMLLVIIVALVIAVVVAFKILANLAKAVLAVSAILFVVSAVVGGIVLMDAIDLKNKLQTQASLQLLANRDGTRILAGLIASHGAAGSAGTAVPEPHALSGAEVDALSQNYSRRDYAAMLGSNYKLIIFNESLLAQSLPQTIEVGGNKVESALILQQLESGDAESRGVAFSVLASFKARQNLSYVISSFREGGIIIYPETPSLKAVKVIPQSFLQSLLGRVAGMAQRAGT